MIGVSSCIVLHCGSVFCSVYACFCSWRVPYSLTMLLTQRHGRVSSLGTEERPGNDFFSWLMRASSSFCSWDGSSLTIHGVYHVTWNARPP